MVFASPREAAVVVVTQHVDGLGDGRAVTWTQQLLQLFSLRSLCPCVRSSDLIVHDVVTTCGNIETGLLRRGGAFGIEKLAVIE